MTGNTYGCGCCAHNDYNYNDDYNYNYSYRYNYNYIPRYNRKKTEIAETTCVRYLGISAAPGGQRPPKCMDLYRKINLR